MLIEAEHVFVLQQKIEEINPKVLVLVRIPLQMKDSESESHLLLPSCMNLSWYPVFERVNWCSMGPQMPRSEETPPELHRIVDIR